MWSCGEFWHGYPRIFVTRPSLSATGSNWQAANSSIQTKYGVHESLTNQQRVSSDWNGNIGFHTGRR